MAPEMILFSSLFQIYDPGGSYLQFSSFDVENRQRVKCVSAQHGVSIRPLSPRVSQNVQTGKLLLATSFSD